MKILMHKSLFALLMLALLAGAGCGKKRVTDEYTPERDSDYSYGELTEEERQAAARISNAVIYFAYDRFDLAPESRNILTEKASVMKQYPQLRVTIEGHCDERGTQEYNLALGERRARAAYDYLVNLGVNPSQMEMVSFGKLHPAVPGYGEAAWAQNRRDEFKVYKLR